MTSTGTPTPPPLIFNLTDAPRAVSELAWFVGARRWLSRQQRADGAPVLVIPGLRAGDWSTAPLRALLGDVGYTAYGWDLGTNLGPTAAAINGLDDRLAQITDHHQRPVAVIGQSLGGILGAELARRHPGSVDRLITLGSPMTMVSRQQSRANNEYEKHVADHLPEFAFEKWITAARPAIPCTSIYSRVDGIIHWSACQYPPDALTENIEVFSSHFGMGAQPAAVYAVLDRLGAPTNPWVKFEAPRRLRCYFPSPRQQAA